MYVCIHMCISYMNIILFAASCTCIHIRMHIFITYRSIDRTYSIPWSIERAIAQLKKKKKMLACCEREQQS